MYVYESHMGGVYVTDYERDWEDLHCETCGDSDWPMGEIETADELRELMKDNYFPEYIEETVKYAFGHKLSSNI
jgi:hypothetical protein